MKTIQTHCAYRLLIDDELRALVKAAIDLEKEYMDSEEYSDKRQELENCLYDMYQEIGWSVVYDIKESPF